MRALFYAHMGLVLVIVVPAAFPHLFSISLPGMFIFLAGTINTFIALPFPIILALLNERNPQKFGLAFVMIDVALSALHFLTILLVCQ